MKVRFIVPWFGPWPIYLDAFLVTCEPNTAFEWLILSDNPPPPAAPPNVTFAHLTLDEFNRRCAEHCGFDLYIEKSNAYKLCDLKWCYGLIFADLLRDTTHWGFCDVDVLWGRISHFITARHLARHDILTSRVRRISGPFTLIRNTPRCNRLYQTFPGFQRVFDTRDSLAKFTETLATDALKALQKARSRRWWKRLLQPWQPHVSWDRLLVNYGDDHLALRDDQYILWDDGRALNPDGTELMYHHFHRLKATIARCNFTYTHRPRLIKLNRREILGERFLVPPPSDAEVGRLIAHAAHTMLNDQPAP